MKKTRGLARTQRGKKGQKKKEGETCFCPRKLLVDTRVERKIKTSGAKFSVEHRIRWEKKGKKTKKMVQDGRRGRLYDHVMYRSSTTVTKKLEVVQGKGEERGTDQNKKRAGGKGGVTGR